MLPMETDQKVQESTLHAGRKAWWPLDTMACSLNYDTTTSSGFLLGWDPQLSYFGLGAWGVGAGDLDAHECQVELVVPKCMESPVSKVSTAVVTGLTSPQDAMALPGELDELLQSLWDSDEEKNAVGFTSCNGLEEASAISSQYDHFALNSILPTSPEKTLTQLQAEPPSSSSSHCNVDPCASDSGVAPRHTTPANSSTKRSASEEKEKGDDQSCKKSRKAPSSTAGAGAGTVARPFTVVKPGGADGSVTLADINEMILTPPARPVRHPVGEFACAPRVSVGHRPAPSGKAVAGFTRLRTVGRGTITIVRTRS